MPDFEVEPFPAQPVAGQDVEGLGQGVVIGNRIGDDGQTLGRKSQAGRGNRRVEDRRFDALATVEDDSLSQHTAHGMANDMKLFPAQIVGQGKDVGRGFNRRVFAGNMARRAVAAHLNECESKIPGVKKIAGKRPGISAAVEVVHDDNAFRAAAVQFVADNHAVLRIFHEECGDSISPYE